MPDVCEGFPFGCGRVSSLGKFLNEDFCFEDVEDFLITHSADVGQLGDGSSGDNSDSGFFLALEAQISLEVFVVGRVCFPVPFWVGGGFASAGDGVCSPHVAWEIEEDVTFTAACFGAPLLYPEDEFWSGFDPVELFEEVAGDFCHPIGVLGEAGAFALDEGGDFFDFFELGEDVRVSFVEWEEGFDDFVVDLVVCANALALQFGCGAAEPASEEGLVPRKFGVFPFWDGCWVYPVARFPREVFNFGLGGGPSVPAF